MTESEWWAATYPKNLRAFVNVESATMRKWQLMNLAWCRILQRQLPNWPCAVHIDLLEEWIEGRAEASAVPSEFNSDALEFGPDARLSFSGTTRRWADCLLENGFTGRAGPIGSNAFTAHERAEQEFIRPVHDIFGPLPFRDIVAHPSWLTTDVLALASGIYDDKAFDRMPILADALQDAGCENDDILSHCRVENWEHVRGCWVIDLLLGRPWREPQ